MEVTFLMLSMFRNAIVLTLSFGVAGANAAVIVSTSAMCSSPPSSPLSADDSSSGASSASAASDLDCIFEGENTGFARGVANGSISGSTQLNLAVTGEARADTGFTLVPGQESAAQGALADMTIALDLLVTGGAPAGVLRITASECGMLAAALGEFRVNGVAEQDLSSCDAGTQVFAPYTRDVPFQISWFIHTQAFSAMDSESDGVGRLTFDAFEVLTTDLEENPGATLSSTNIPEPSSIMLVSGAVLALLGFRGARARYRKA
jgi:hypothetical protein